MWTILKIFIEFVTMLPVLCFVFSGREACGIPAPWPGIKPAPLALEGEVLPLDHQGSPDKENTLRMRGFMNSQDDLTGWPISVSPSADSLTEQDHPRTIWMTGNSWPMRKPLRHEKESQRQKQPQYYSSSKQRRIMRVQPRLSCACQCPQTGGPCHHLIYTVLWRSFHGSWWSCGERKPPQHCRNAGQPWKMSLAWVLLCLADTLKWVWECEVAFQVNPSEVSKNAVSELGWTLEGELGPNLPTLLYTMEYLTPPSGKDTFLVTLQLRETSLCCWDCERTLEMAEIIFESEDNDLFIYFPWL